MILLLDLRLAALEPYLYIYCINKFTVHYSYRIRTSYKYFISLILLRIWNIGKICSKIGIQINVMLEMLKRFVYDSPNNLHIMHNICVHNVYCTINTCTVNIYDCMPQICKSTVRQV